MYGIVSLILTLFGRYLNERWKFDPRWWHRYQALWRHESDHSWHGKIRTLPYDTLNNISLLGNARSHVPNHGIPRHISRASRLRAVLQQPAVRPLDRVHHSHDPAWSPARRTVQTVDEFVQRKCPGTTLTIVKTVTFSFSIFSTSILAWYWGLMLIL